MEMKVFNVRDTEGFFETLSKCTGKVEIIGKGGNGVPMIMDSDKMQMLRNIFIGGMINDIELKLSDSADYDGSVKRIT